jgi:hypothetical protein
MHHISMYLTWRTNANAPDPDEVQEDLLLDFTRLVGGVVAFVRDTSSPAGILKVLHGFQRFPGVPGKMDQERKQVFCYEGEVTGVDMVTVAFDEEQLDYVSAVNVPRTTIERVIQLLEEEPSHHTIGPLRVGDTRVRTVTATRSCMYLPFRYMLMVLGQDLTACEACLLLLPAIVNDGLQQSCRELVDFLVVGVTKAATGIEGTYLVLPRLGLRDFQASPTVINSRHETVLYRHLPSLAPAMASVGDPALVGISASMNSIASAMHNDLAVRESRYKENKKAVTVRDKYGYRTADMLLLLTRSDDDNDLPDYYQGIASKPKGLSERVIFQREVDAAADVMGLVPFQVTPSQVMNMKSFDFCGPAYSEIGTGILPFSITPPDATSDRDRAAIMADRARAETYDLSGEAVNGAIITSGAARMRNLKGYVPADWTEARMQLQGMAVMMGALLGTTHPILAVYTTFLRKYNAMEPRVRREFELVYGARLAPPSWCSTCNCSGEVGSKTKWAVTHTKYCHISAAAFERWSIRTIWPGSRPAPTCHNCKHCSICSARHRRQEHHL